GASPIEIVERLGSIARHIHLVHHVLGQGRERELDIVLAVLREQNGPICHSSVPPPAAPRTAWHRGRPRPPPRHGRRGDGRRAVLSPIQCPCPRTRPPDAGVGTRRTACARSGYRSPRRCP